MTSIDITFNQSEKDTTVWPISKPHTSEGKQWQATRRGIPHRKEGHESFRQGFLSSVVSASSRVSRMDKLKLFPIKADETNAPSFL